MNQSFTSIVLVALFLTGCTTTKSIQYPSNGSNTTISVSSEQISAMTESNVGDYFIDGSQITVGDASNTTASTVSAMFGFVGLGISTAIDKRSNGSTISKSTLKQAIKFDQLVKQKIDSALKVNQVDPSLKILSSNQSADVKVVPFARISFREKPNVQVNYGLKAQFKNAADNNAATKRIYNYIGLKKLPLASWDSNNNEFFMQSANKAFEALSQTLVMDIQHQLNIDITSEAKQKSCRINPNSVYVKFIESPDNLCIGVAQYKDKAFPNMLFIIEQ